VSHLFGYAASVILLVTIATQIRNQWKHRTIEGVSPWLFVGQLAASIGFAIHSAIIASTLFVVTNVLLGVSAMVGMAMWLVLQRRNNRRQASPGAARIHREVTA
jgi:MtN3 and saliva related transmembrane protein